MLKKILLLAAVSFLLHSEVLAQNIDFSNLKCTDRKTLRAFFTDLNKVTRKQFDVGLLDIKNPSHVSATKDTITCRGLLIFDNGEQIQAKFWYEVNSVGVPLVYFKEE